MNSPSFISVATSKLVAGKALKVALVVGTVLALINHGDKFLGASMTSKDWIKMLFCYFVPYGVSTWSAVSAIRASRSSADKDNDT